MGRAWSFTCRRGSPSSGDRVDWSSIRPRFAEASHASPRKARANRSRDAACRGHQNLRAVGGRLESETHVRCDPRAPHRGERSHVANSFVNRNLMSAIAERHTAEFVWQAQLTLAVFAGSTIVAVVARFAEERLGVLWREFVTERCVAAYMVNGTYYRLAMSGELANPDQRIAEDTRAFTATHALLRSPGP